MTDFILHDFWRAPLHLTTGQRVRDPDTGEWWMVLRLATEEDARWAVVSGVAVTLHINYRRVRVVNARRLRAWKRLSTR